MKDLGVVMKKNYLELHRRNPASSGVLITLPASRPRRPEPNFPPKPCIETGFITYFTERRDIVGTVLNLTLYVQRYGSCFYIHFLIPSTAKYGTFWTLRRGGGGSA